MLRLLIGANSNRRIYLERLAESLADLGIECKIINDRDYDGYPSKNIRTWISSDRKFAKLVSDFKPDVIMVDRVRGFASKAANSKIPTIIYLRGDYWKGLDWTRKTTKSFIRRKALKKWERISNGCFSKAVMIMPICEYVEKIAKRRHPNVPMHMLQNFVNTSEWFNVEPMKLRHPCVGLLQNAGAWEKTQEMLLLKEILPVLPDVTFYWAGEGEFAETILKELEGFPNFKWMGPMEYPGKVREYLAGIDAYALISGIDMSPSSLLEAQLMQRVVLATNVGGIPECMEDDRTGFLIPAGDSDGWIKKIKYVLDNPDMMKEMGEDGRKFVEDNFGLDKRAKELSDILKDVVR